jgi:catechol 2,3-dioxygenase-like lactoylglutathione lyase family enzyme
MKSRRIHHVQITIAPDEVEQARAFYCDVLGLEEVEKPEELKPRGGFWLVLADQQIHVGVEDRHGQKPTKAHIAYQVDDLNAWRQRLEAVGIHINESVPISGFARFEFRDPFGNRVEMIQPDTL